LHPPRITVLQKEFRSASFLLVRKSGGCIMRSVRWRLVCACLALAVPRSIAAQDWDRPWSDPRDRPPRVDLSVSAGMVAPTDWSDLVVLGTISPIAGALEQVLVRDLRVEPDREFGAAVTYWEDRYGFRVQGGLSRSSLIVGADLGATAAPVGEVRAADVDSWFYDVRGVVGLVEYSPTRRVLPYAFIGFGGITYDMDRTITPPLLTFIERRPAGFPSSGDIVVVEDDGREFLLSVDELGRETVFAGNFGVGTDLRIPMAGSALGLRLEFSDHVARSPVGLRIRELGSSGGLTSAADVRFGVVHHLRLAVGVVVQVGR
jgi:hypothetical protein